MLAAALLAPLLVWLATGVIRRIPDERRARQLGATADTIVDLAEDVDPERDHIRGRVDAPVTLLEYGDFECPYCGHAAPVIDKLLEHFGDELRYVFRHLPLNDVHPNAQLAAEAAEAAGAQGRFWEMHDRLLAQPGRARAARPLPPRLGARPRPRALLRRHAAPRATPAASPTTCRAPTRAASPARRRSSSTAAATRASTTSTR